MTVYAYAKINLALSVGEKMPDGYHRIDTLMHSVPLCDEVELSIEDGTGIELFCDDDRIPTDEKNSAFKAAAAFLAKGSFSGKLRISIKKRIPLASGFGGSCTDGAAVLLGLWEHFGKPFSWEELSALSAELSADMPFCLEAARKGRSSYLPFYARCTGKGERISELPSPLANTRLLLFAGDGGVSAGKMYCALDERSSSLLKREKEFRGTLFFNDFEAVAFEFCPDVKKCTDELYKAGADIAMMSGSGYGVFALFDSKKDVKTAHGSVFDAVGVWEL